MNWSDLRNRQPIYLNLGGGPCCDPREHYEGYVSVDIEPVPGASAVQHDLSQPFPLPDASVERVLTEDCLEHLERGVFLSVLNECHRILVPGGLLRIGVPDYGNPKDYPFLNAGSDPRFPDHVTLTTYDLVRELIEESSFERAEFLHYWDRGKFVQRPIDYSLGMVRRTPDHPAEYQLAGFVRKLKQSLRDRLYRLSRGSSWVEEEMSTRPGRPLSITSLVVDLHKP